MYALLFSFHLISFLFKKKEFTHKETYSLSNGQAMSPMTSEMTSNTTFIVQNDAVHSTHDKDVHNMTIAYEITFFSFFSKKRAKNNGNRSKRREKYMCVLTAKIIILPIVD